MGIPIIVAGQVSGVDTMEISQMVGRQLPFNHYCAVLDYGDYGWLAWC